MSAAFHLGIMTPPLRKLTHPSIRLQFSDVRHAPLGSCVRKCVVDEVVLVGTPQNLKIYQCRYFVVGEQSAGLGTNVNVGLVIPIWYVYESHSNSLFPKVIVVCDRNTKR